MDGHHKVYSICSSYEMGAVKMQTQIHAHNIVIWIKLLILSNNYNNVEEL